MALVHPIPTRPAALTLTLGALALLGWGAFAYSERSAAAMERDWADQVSHLTTERDHLRAERTQLQASVGEVEGQLAAAREDHSRSLRARDQAKADLASAQQQLAALTKRLEHAKARAMQAGAVTPPPAPVRPDQPVKQRVAQAGSDLVPVPPAKIPERAKEQAR